MGVGFSSTAECLSEMTRSSQTYLIPWLREMARETAFENVKIQPLKQWKKNVEKIDNLLLKFMKLLFLSFSFNIEEKESFIFANDYFFKVI